MSLDNILLAMLAEPASGYDLGGEFNESARMFWFAELSQIYPTLRRLESKGFLRSSEAASTRGPKRRVYERTPQGDAALNQWLRAEPEVRNVRLAYVAQLYFLGQLGDAAATRRFIEALRIELETLIERYETIEERFRGECANPSSPETTDVEFHHYAALRAGVYVARARLAWCDETMAELDRRDSRSSEGEAARSIRESRQPATAVRGA